MDQTEARISLIIPVLIIFMWAAEGLASQVIRNYAQ
jgi:hypothetical protein